jgi:hypothetical protein
MDLFHDFSDVRAAGDAGVEHVTSFQWKHGHRPFPGKADQVNPTLGVAAILWPTLCNYSGPSQQRAVDKKTAKAINQLPPRRRT